MRESLKSVATALKVFEAVAELEPAGVSDVARHLGRTKSTVQRCLSTLQEAGWIRPAAQRKWRVSARVVALARRAGDTRALRRAAVPVMQRLRDETGDSVQLAVREGRDLVVVAGAAGPSSGGAMLPRGTRIPLHASANGKAILARSSEAEIDAYVAGGLPALTKRTARDGATLRRDLARANARGWALVVDELLEGTSSIACAILDQGGIAIASIAIYGPTRELTSKDLARLGKKLREAAVEIGAAFRGDRRPSGARGLRRSGTASLPRSPT